MSRRDERVLAARLARVLDGDERGDDELRALVTVLERATEPARFELPAEDVEHELARARPRLQARPRRRHEPRLALAFGAAAVAAVALVVFTFVRLPGVDVEGKALAALAGGSILKIEERIEPVVPGTFPASTRTVWLDRKRGLEKWTQVLSNLRVEETLVEPHRISRFLTAQNVIIVGTSCRAFASGCADVIDPVSFYRRALAGDAHVKAKRSGDVYELTVPVQTLPDAVRIEQHVTIDADTFLPKTIVWTEQKPGRRARAFSRIVITSVQRLPRREAVGVFSLSQFGPAKVVQRTTSREPLRKLGETRLSLAQARRLDPPLLWLGPSYLGQRLRGIDALRWNAGVAYRLRYGPATVWNYSTVVPPELAPNRFGAGLKPLPVGRNVARFYSSASGKSVAEIDTRTRSAAVVAPLYGKEDVYGAVQRLRALH